MRSAPTDHSDSHFVSCAGGREASGGTIGVSVRRLLTTPSLVPDGRCRPSDHEPIPTRGSGIDRQCRFPCGKGRLERFLGRASEPSPVRSHLSSPTMPFTSPIVVSARSLKAALKGLRGILCSLVR